MKQLFCSVKLKAIFLYTDISYYCEKRKAKRFLINIYIERYKILAETFKIKAASFWRSSKFLPFQMYFIHRGTVEVVSEHDEPIVFDTMGEGRFFGEISVVFSCPRTASIRYGETATVTFDLILLFWVTHGQADNFGLKFLIRLLIRL